MVHSTPEMWENHTLTFDHTFNAPRALVWEAWTQAEPLAEWWGPESFTNPRCEVNMRPGGAIHIDMQGPDGVTYPMAGVVREVHEPERLVFVSSALNHAGEAMFEVLYTATFAADGDVTHLSLETRVLTVTPVAGQYLPGMEAGWTQSLQKLDRFLNSRNNSSSASAL